MEKIQVNLILEVLGRPADYVKETVEALISKISAENGIKVLEKVLHDPLPIENSKDLFTSFVELELELDSLEIYFNIIFAYMPSNIEIVKPQKLALSNLDFNLLANKLVTRLHDYDALAKKAILENEILAGKLHEVAPHLFKNQPSAQETAPEVKKPEKISKKPSKKKPKKPN